ncbi:Cadherin member 2 [Rhizophlyctis rosea]|nr:Cadherin member 2 [Rhizophlyctis rosea]
MALAEAPNLAYIVVSNYEGDTQDGQYDGQGTAEFIAGHRYSGTWAKGKMDGEGHYEWNDGVSYKGTFKANKIVGRGSYSWTNGCTYEGHLQDGLRHGHGEFKCKPSHAQYVGEWKAGKVNGKGRLDYSPTSYYKGEWLEGQKHGYGIMTYASGNIYEGQWVHNVKQGEGTMQWKDRDEEYAGHWENNQPNGHGVYIWHLPPTHLRQFPMQNRYEGQWLDGKRSGHGTFQYASGARYEGDWKDNMKHGLGCYVSDNGRRYVGEFVNDRMAGEFQKYENECPYVFRLRDLLPAKEAENTDGQLKQLNNVLLRHIGDLRSIYEHYSSLGRHILEDTETTAMTKCQLWRLFRDCRMESKGISLVDINRAYAVQFKDDPSYPHRYNHPHAPTDSLILYDFLDHLLRIAHMAYGTRTDLSIHETGLPAALGYLIKTDLLPNAKRSGQLEHEISLSTDTAADGKTLFNAIADDLKDESENHYMKNIHRIYTDLARRRPKSLPDSPGDVTMTIRDFLLMLKDYGLIQDLTGSLTVPHVINIFAKYLPAVVDNGSYNLEFELVPYELFAAIYECIMVQHKDYVENTLIPVLEGRPVVSQTPTPADARNPSDSVATEETASHEQGGATDASKPGAVPGQPSPSTEPQALAPQPAQTAVAVAAPATTSSKGAKHVTEKEKDREKDKDREKEKDKDGSKTLLTSKAATDVSKTAAKDKEDQISMIRTKSVNKSFLLETAKDRDKDAGVQPSLSSAQILTGADTMPAPESQTVPEENKIPGHQVTSTFKELVKKSFEDLLSAHERMQKMRIYELEPGQNEATVVSAAAQEA